MSIFNIYLQFVFYYPVSYQSYDSKVFFIK